MSDELESKVQALVRSVAQQAQAQQAKIATAESLTGGLVAQLLTAPAGATAWFDRGWVTYTESAKIAQLGVPSDVIERQGVVSSATAQAMARGALAQSQATMSVALTGVAGPTGGTALTPVGTVWLGWAIYLGNKDIATCSRAIWVPGQREIVRWSAALVALQGLLALLCDDHPQTMATEFSI